MDIKYKSFELKQKTEGTLWILTYDEKLPSGISRTVKQKSFNIHPDLLAEFNGFLTYVCDVHGFFLHKTMLLAINFHHDGNVPAYSFRAWHSSGNVENCGGEVTTDVVIPLQFHDSDVFTSKIQMLESHLLQFVKGKTNQASLFDVVHVSDNGRVWTKPNGDGSDTEATLEVRDDSGDWKTIGKI